MLRLNQAALPERLGLRQSPEAAKKRTVATFTCVPTPKAGAGWAVRIERTQLSRRRRPRRIAGVGVTAGGPRVVEVPPSEAVKRRQ
jgi:hypothetical protein